MLGKMAVWPDHDDFGSNRSKVMNVIDSNKLERDGQISVRNLRKLDCVEKPVSTFSHLALALICGVLGISALGLGAARADEAACKGIADAMLTNSKTPYHSLGTITFDPKDPPIPGSQSMPAIKTETIFTGTQVFVKLPTGQWKDIHANVADLQTRVKDSAGSFNDCARLPDEKSADGKTLAVYTGSDKTDTMTVSTKVWVGDGAIQRSETDVGGPTAPDGKVRHQHLSLNYDYTGIKAPAASN